MSLDVDAVRQFVVSTIVLPGVNKYPEISGDQDLPALVVGNPDGEGTKYVKTYKGTAALSLPVWFIVSRANETTARKALDAAISVGIPGSVYSALRALVDAAAAPWQSMNVLGSGPYGSLKVGQAQALAVKFDLSITA